MVDTAASGLLEGDGNSQEPDANSIPCIRCGECCTRYQALAELGEVNAIAARLGITVEQFWDAYADSAWPGVRNFLLCHVNGACVFLKQGENQAMCRIEKYKPYSCRAWSASLSRKECRAGLQKRWGLSVNEAGKLEGPAEKLAEFRAYLEKLNSEGGSDANLRISMQKLLDEI